MKKHVFKKNFALGVLIACSLTGSVHAMNVNVSAGETQSTPPKLL